MKDAIIKKMRISKGKLKNLPIFYNYVLYNELHNVDVYYVPPYSDKIGNYVTFAKPDKLTSKIIDFSSLNELL